LLLGARCTAVPVLRLVNDPVLPAVSILPDAWGVLAPEWVEPHDPLVWSVDSLLLNPRGMGVPPGSEMRR